MCSFFQCVDLPPSRLFRSEGPSCAIGFSWHLSVHVFMSCLRLCVLGFSKAYFGPFFLQAYLFRGSRTHDLDSDVWFEDVCGSVLCVGMCSNLQNMSSNEPDFTPGR